MTTPRLVALALALAACATTSTGPRDDAPPASTPAAATLSDRIAAIDRRAPLPDPVPLLDATGEAAASPAEEPVTFTMRLAEGLERCRLTQRKQRDGKPHQLNVGTETMQLLRRADGLWEQARVHVEIPPGLDAQGRALAELEPPRFVFTEKFELVRLDGFDTFAEGLERMLDAPPALRPQLRKAVELGLRREFQDGLGLLAFFHGASLDVGDEYAIGGDLEADPPVEPRVRFIVDGRVPCAAGQGDERCVRVRLRSNGDTAQAEMLIRELVPAGADHEVTALSTVFDVTLVVEPDGLVLHQMRRAMHSVVEAQVDGKVERLEQLDVRDRVCERF